MYREMRRRRHRGVSAIREMESRKAVRVQALRRVAERGGGVLVGDGESGPEPYRFEPGLRWPFEPSIRYRREGAGWSRASVPSAMATSRARRTRAFDRSAPRCHAAGGSGGFDRGEDGGPVSGGAGACRLEGGSFRGAG